MKTNAPVLLSVRDLKVQFSMLGNSLFPWRKAATLTAVDKVNFDIAAGETLGIVGESGCGKSTLARAIMRLLPAQSGQVLWLGEDLLSKTKQQLRAARAELQMIFQDPLASLNPRLTAGEIIAEPLRTHRPQLSAAERQARVQAMMLKVGLLPNQRNRYPHEFSGGQCQRIGIARALILEPKLIICDEPVSALDVSIQAQIVNLLMDIQEEMGLALMFIAHDLNVVQHISDRVMVLYLGHVCEIAPSEQLYRQPRHPYTRALIDAVPIPDPMAAKHKQPRLLTGDVPSPINPPSGCVFRTRCHKAQANCARTKPTLQALSEHHEIACHYPD